MNILSRSDAKQAGAKRYFSGQPCKHGHLSERFTACGYCVTCHSERVARKAVELKAYYAARYRAHKPEFVKRALAHRIANRDLKIAQAKAWQAKNPDLVREYKRKNKHMRRASEGSFTRRDVAALVRIQRDCCAACSVRLSGKFHIDHVIPLKRGGTNWCGNLQLLCASCNHSKSSLLPIEWRARHTVNARMFA